MSGDVKRRMRRGEKGARLSLQVERARKMAAECGSPMLAELFELHAQICERNAKVQKARKPKLTLV